jgi:hypothetical protein
MTGWKFFFSFLVSDDIGRMKGRKLFTGQKVETNLDFSSEKKVMIENFTGCFRRDKHTKLVSF